MCGKDAQTVYISGGGTVFHIRRDCEALIKGQRKVERRGGDVSEITAVSPRSSYLVETRDPCKTCIVKPLKA